MLETVVTDRALTGYCHTEGNDITQIAQVSKLLIEPVWERYGLI